MRNNDEMTLQQVLALIERKIKENRWTQEQAADAWGVSDSYLSAVRKGKQNPGKLILDALDLEHLDKYRFKRK
jgi:transcriptional regulator with XRE-family HTH domain